MNFIKKHWFGLLISIIIFAYAIIFVLVLASPKQDLQKRGFIVCTEEFVFNAYGCEGSMCLVGAIYKNSACEAKVISKGFVNWIKGEQKTPWSNYLFEPELAVEEEVDVELQEFYDDNPNLIYDIEKLKRLSEELENERSKASGMEPE